MKILFKCYCMKKETELNVRARADGEDIDVWMREVVQPTASRYHAIAHPRCKSPKCEYIKVPASQHRPVGTELH